MEDIKHFEPTSFYVEYLDKVQTAARVLYFIFSILFLIVIYALGLKTSSLLQELESSTADLEFKGTVQRKLTGVLSGIVPLVFFLNIMG
jgi:hypothetical protein